MRLFQVWKLPGILAVAVTFFGLVTTAGAQKGPRSNSLEAATFAGGCFWCVEEAFDPVGGVVSTTSGYIGGHKKNPTYEQVSAGGTGHTEAVEIKFDPRIVSYGELLDVYWRNSDPTTPNRQFCDVGSQYRPEIFYHNEMQKKIAVEAKRTLVKSKPFSGRVWTKITPASEFYKAEEYHQDFYLKNPLRYKLYKYKCGRAQRLEQLWGKTP
jgi:peptide-methionine (S)-S-oxide reductase